MAYAQGDTKQTITLYAEVIRHDPYVIAAWNTLASVYEEEGNEEGARQMRFFAAHVEDEGDTWKDLARQFRQVGKIDQCLYCLRKALNRENADVGVLFELASIYRMTGATKKVSHLGRSHHSDERWSTRSRGSSESRGLGHMTSRSSSSSTRR
jgi:tetratricopeptide (TPR) repeat protein